MRSILEYFEPEKKYTRDQINELTNKIEGKCSWPYFCMKSLLNDGYQIKLITPYGINEILENGFENYLIKVQGRKDAPNTIKISPPINDIERACTDINKDKNLIQIIKTPDISDIKELLKEGYLIKSMVDARALNKLEGYNGHAVLIYAMDETHIYFHDSGLPPVPDRKETIDFFIQCAKTPKETNWFMIGYKK